MLTPPRRALGFTLLEVLVATSVIAFALAAIIQSTVVSSANLTHLRDKTFAHWVAMNQMAELQVNDSFPAIRRSSGDEQMGGREWFWTMEVQKTPDQDLRRVEIKVRKEQRKEVPALTVLTGFFTRYSGQQKESGP
ncbi:MAG: type II secretion system minor pseudopilin GspI [Pseudomonadota bacterium]